MAAEPLLATAAAAVMRGSGPRASNAARRGAINAVLTVGSERSPRAVADSVFAFIRRGQARTVSTGGPQLLPFPRRSQARVTLSSSAVVLIVLMRATREVGDALRRDQQSTSGGGRVPASLYEPVLTQFAVHLAQVAVSHAIHDDVNGRGRRAYPAIRESDLGCRSRSAAAADRSRAYFTLVPSAGFNQRAVSCLPSYPGTLTADRPGPFPAGAGPGARACRGPGDCRPLGY